MSIRTRVSLLAAVITLIGGTAPAYGMPARETAPGAPQVKTAVVAKSTDGSGDFAVVGAVVGGLALAGGAVAVSRRTGRRMTSTVKTPSGS